MDTLARRVLQGLVLGPLYKNLEQGMKLTLGKGDQYLPKPDISGFVTPAGSPGAPDYSQLTPGFNPKVPRIDDALDVKEAQEIINILQQKKKKRIPKSRRTGKSKWYVGKKQMRQQQVWYIRRKNKYKKNRTYKM